MDILLVYKFNMERDKKRIALIEEKNIINFVGKCRKKI